MDKKAVEAEKAMAELEASYRKACEWMQVVAPLLSGRRHPQA